MYSRKPELRRVIESIRDNNVTMIVSGTGSGKTVVTPKLAHRLLVDALPRLSLAQKARLWLEGRRPPGATVAVTNPKALTTRENATFSAKLACVTLGREIGYRHRDSPGSAASLDTRLEYVTDGYLLSVARRDPDFSEYGTVVVDEAHERPVPTDFLLLALKRAMLRRPELRVVVMSATIDTTPFVEWFRRDGLAVGDISVSGKPNFPVKKTYLAVPKGQTYLTKAVETVMELNRSPDAVPGGVLIFVPVTADTAAGCQLLTEECRKAGLRCSREPTGDDTPNLRCLRLYSGVDEGEKEAAISPSATTATRHVVFSTNVAESSLTVEDLSYVIDSGQVFRVSYDAVNDVTVSGKQSVTKAEATQRTGRVGRKRPGVAILLYPKKVHDERFAEWPDPSILQKDVTAELFEEMASRGLTWAETVDEVGRMLTPPSPAQVSIAGALMEFYGFVGAGAFTETGESFYRLYRAARAELADCLLLFAARMTGAERAAARYVACTEKGALSWLSAALGQRGKMPEECGASDHATAVRVFEAATRALPAETAALRARAEQLEEAALGFEVAAEVAGTWPWGWLQRQQGLGVIFGCAFTDSSKRCPPSAGGRAVELRKCDEFFRAVAAAGLMRANRGGERLFGAGSRPALGSRTTRALQSAVNAGPGYSAHRDAHVLSRSTAFEPESLAGLLAARR